MFFDAPRPVRALLFAADAGEGFTTSRWREPWSDTTLIDHVVAGALEWDVEELVVVLGADAEEIVAEHDLRAATVIIDPEWEEGPSAWLRVGLDVLARQGDYGPAMIADAAMPMVTADDVAALVRGHDPQVAPVTVATYRYSSGAPYIVEPELWFRFMGREGESSLDSAWRGHPEWVAEVRIDKTPPRRIRTPSDLDELSPSH